MSYAQRLKRVFGIDVETCRACFGAVRMVACIEGPVVIEKILTHLDEKGASSQAHRLPQSRAPPGGGIVRLIHRKLPDQCDRGAVDLTVGTSRKVAPACNHPSLGWSGKVQTEIVLMGGQNATPLRWDTQ